ncbi:MAG: hypothetical protein MAG431_01145 [Chloroflexi bacterium]|nr:hypothetical protein [Chloroflexota bacterium]
MERREILLLGLIALLSLAVYLIVSKLVYRIGFPLDDAWIHQAYARNLVKEGRWTFLVGKSSGGSTGPLWGFFLSPFHFFKLGPYVGAYLLGFVSLWGASLLGSYLFGLMVPEQKDKRLWIGILLAMEWHLAWAAGSGMETLLFTCLVLVSFVLLASANINWSLLGLTIGLSVWVRPGGITLLGPAGLALLLDSGSFRKKIFEFGKLVLGFSLCFAPYLVFNRVMAGDWWPNTLYAKQAEYAVLRQIPFWKRALDLGLLPLIGAGVILLPGFFLFLWRSVRGRKWKIFPGALWGMGYVLLYAWRLPVTYQHGRYLIPIIPVLVVWGMAGLWGWAKPEAASAGRRILSRVWILSLVVVGVAFWARGARAYADDVAVIESEMVHMAKWINENLPEDAVVAAHDIGALGYFGEREIVDLAGLVSPEVISFIRDEAALEEYLNAREVEYLLTLQGWYPQLEEQAFLEYKSTGEHSPRLGGENMVLYQWKFP